MADEAKSEKKHLPSWAKKLLVVVSIVGPLTGATVTIVDAFYDVRSKARDATSKTKASYDTLAPAVKELQELLSKTQDVVDAQAAELASLKSDRDEKEKRIIRLEAYIELLGRRPSLPSAPPEVKPDPKPPVVVSKVRKLKPPEAPIPSDVGGAQQMQQMMLPKD